VQAVLCHRLTIWCGTRHAADADASSSCAAKVFNNDGLAWQGPHTFGYDTRDDVR
jgi:hypothetical protein